MSKEEWPLRQASRRLGVSVDTLRRRLKTGALEARTVAGKHGATWQILVEAPPTAGARPVSRHPDIRHLWQMVEQLQGRMAAAAARIEHMQAELRRHGIGVPEEEDEEERRRR